VELDGAAERRRGPGRLTVGRAGLHPHDLENPLETHAPAGHPDGLLGDFAQGTVEGAHVVNEHVEIAGRQLSAEHFPDAEPDNSAGCQRADDVDAAHVLRFEPGSLDARANALGALTMELLLLKILAAERLDDAERADGLLRHRRHFDLAASLLLRGFLDPPAETPLHRTERDHRDRADQGQWPV